MNIFKKAGVLATTDLSLGDGLDPCGQDTHAHHDGTDGQETLTEESFRAVNAVSEDDGENDTAQVSGSTDDTGDDTVGVRVDVRNKRVVESVRTLKEEADTTSDETDEGGAGVRVDYTGDDHEHTGKSDVNVKEHLLAPRSRHTVCVIGNNTTKRSEDDVEETEHGSPITRVLKTELEVAAVVVTENAVDGKLAAERAEVADTEDEGLRREDDRDGILEGRLLDDFATYGIEHLFLAHLSFVVGESTTSLVELLLLAGDVRARR